MSNKSKDRQEMALKELERAFKKCAKIGLSFFCMDGELLYVPLGEPGGHSPSPDWPQHVVDYKEGKGGTVNTHGAIFDSGGF